MTSSSSSPDPAVGTGAHPIGDDGDRRRRPAWLFWLLGLLALIVLAIILFALLHHSGNGKNAAAPAASPSDSTAASSPTPSATASSTPATDATASSGPSSGTGTAGSPGAAAGGGTGSAAAAQRGQLLAGSASVLTRPAGQSLSRYAGRPATADHVRVLSVPVDEGFWVGSSTKDRVWVHLTGAGESPYAVHVGDLVSFTDGTAAANGAGYAHQVGVTEAEGADQLTAEGQHIDVPRSGLPDVRG